MPAFLQSFRPSGAGRLAVAKAFALTALSIAAAAAGAADVSVGPQYDTTHVYVSNDSIDAFVDSFVATFDGKPSPRAVFTVTPTPSKTASQYVQTPVGMLSVFAFQTPIPYGFGDERNGYLVDDLPGATEAARAAGADVIVAPFDDPIGKDSVIAWAGGVKMQLYWHTKAPNYAPLRHVPDNRVYVSPQSADKFVGQFLAFSHGKVLADEMVDGGEIGRGGEKIRRIRISSGFGKMRVFVSDGKLPWPFGRESTGYEVDDLAATMARAGANKATVVSPPYAVTGGGHSAVLQFPGGYIAEIHDAK